MHTPFCAWEDVHNNTTSFLACYGLSHVKSARSTTSPDPAKGTENKVPVYQGQKHGAQAPQHCGGMVVYLSITYILKLSVWNNASLVCGQAPAL